MGYYSNFSIRLAGCTSDERNKVVKEIESVSGYKFERKSSDGCETEDHTWYDYRKHLAKISKKHPDVYIEVMRTGEDRDDQEINRFHAGETEGVTAEIVFPPFSQIILPGEESSPVIELKTALSCFTDEELTILRDIIHDYKDTNRGQKKMLIPVMELEKKFAMLSDGRYVPDTTYDWKETSRSILDEFTFVDLGLPSGRLWATENVKDENGNEAYLSFNKAIETYGKNLPSKEDWEELFDNCSCKWDKMKKGFYVTGPNGNSIFLPAAGYRGGGVKNVETTGHYWSSSVNDEEDAYNVHFYSCYLDPRNNSNRYFEFSVRLCK